MGLGKSFQAVMCVGRDGLAVALQQQGQSSPVAVQSFPAAQPLSLDNLSTLEALLVDVKVWLAENVGSSFLELSLYLADPLMTHQVLALEAWPKSRREQAALVRWRLGEVLGQDKDTLSVVWEVFPAQQGGVQVHAMAMPVEWHEMLVGGFRDQGWPVLVLGSQALALPSSPANDEADDEKILELFVGNEYWLARHREGGIVTQLRCRWFGGDDQALAREIARSVNVEGVSRAALFSFEIGGEKAGQACQQIGELLNSDAFAYDSLPVERLGERAPLQQMATFMLGVA